MKFEVQRESETPGYVQTFAVLNVVSDNVITGETGVLKATFKQQWGKVLTRCWSCMQQ